MYGNSRNIETKSSTGGRTTLDAGEGFVTIGTPLPPLNPEKGDAAFVPIWKQEVRDEKGRRRFHGAFTGGFSAGYFNSVGSKEGWAPTSFKSSRTERASARQSRLEDYMDEEDLEMLAESRKLSAQDEFATDAQQIQKDILQDVLLPPKESIGIKLLRQMGWRPGQGIGPRISGKKRKSDDPDGESDIHAGNYTFAPEDTVLIKFDHKNNVFGLGYAKRIEVQKDDSQVETDSKPRRAGIGIGVLEDDDDMQVYEDEPANPKSIKFALKHLDEDEDDEDFRSPIKFKTVKKVKKQMARAHCKEKDQAVKKTLFRKPVLQIGYDGKPPLKSFRMASIVEKLEKWFPFPQLPKDYVPSCPFRLIKEDTVKSDGKQLSIDERGAKLGAEPINAPVRSVFDYLKPQDRERLQNLTLNKKPDIESSKRNLEIPVLDAQTAMAALNGYIPFGDNKEKQLRYKQYLQVQANTLSTSTELMAGIDFHQAKHELDEFVKAAKMFRPMSSMMASRFASAGSTNVSTDSSSSQSEMLSIGEGGLRQARPKDPKEEAAKMGMYGALTRSVKDFYPARLLCKRFNIRNPFPEDKDESQVDMNHSDKQRHTQQMENMLGRMSAVVRKDVLGMDKLNEIMVAGGHEGIQLPTQTKQKEKEDRNDTEDDLPQRPAMDIFKAIFADDMEKG